MISKQDILAMVHHIRRHHQSRTERRLIHPEREWSIGLSIFCLLIVVGGVVNISLYQRFNHLETELAPPQSRSTVYQAALVDDVRAAYAKRTAAFAALRAESEPLLPATTVSTSTATSSTARE